MRLALLEGTLFGLVSIGLAFPAGAIDADDQIRYCAAFEMPQYEKVRAMGFNHLSAYGTYLVYNYETDTFEGFDREAFSALATRCAADGIDFSVTFQGGKFQPDMVRFAPLRRDGKPFVRIGEGKTVKPCIDASHPGYREILVKAAHAVAKECASLHSPAFAGVRGLEEVRLWSQPSFAERNRAAYRAFSGHDIPGAVLSKVCVPWDKAPGMPADRLVDGDYPLLNYYRWFWKTGDGWAEANDLASETIQSHFDRPLMTLYMPGRRTPALPGIGGRKATHLGDWCYLYPFPFTIAAKIAELQANARGTGAKVIATVDGIFKSSDTLPPEKAPNPLPAWYEKCKKRNYPTVPPAWMTEAYWLMLAKRTDGVGLSIAPAVFGRAPGSKYWAEKTNDGAARTVEKVMKEVATLLGPLLKNMPERAPEVALFESNAGFIFSGRASWGWTMRANRLADYLTAANLPPYVFFDEELETSGLPPSVKVVFLPDCNVLTKSSAEKLAALRARGVRLVGEPTLAPGLKADATMPGAEHPLYTTDGTLKGAESDRAVRALAAQLRALAGFKPYVDSDNPWILISARSSGSADLVFAVNDKRAAGDYIGGWGTMLDDAVPNAGKVTVRRAAGAVYDLVRHTKVDFSVEDGRTVIPVSYETTDGRALLVTARPLVPLKAGVRDGWLAVGSDDADVMVPFGVLDAEGKALKYGVLRNGRWKRPLPAGAVKVLNLATGETTAILGAADGGDRLEICMSGFSEAVRTEKGVLDLKAIGADSASGIPWTDRATLDLFEKHGLKAVVNGLPNWFGGKTELVGRMAELHPLSEFEAAAATWRMHPAIREVVVGDEPGKPDFAHYGKVFDLVREKMPGAIPNVPIFPDYGSHIARGDAEAKVQMGTDSYEDYVRNFCTLVPSATSLKVDFYPYSAPAERRAEYFERRFSTMDVAARTAREFGKRLCLYVQCNSVFKDFKMTLPRMRYLAFTSLAYGARELNFTCYTPSWWKHNILDKKGNRTARYEMVRQLISELRAFDRAYMRFATTGTKVVGTFPAATALGTLSAEDGGRIVVGEMTSPAGERALCIAGADDPEGANVRIRRLTLKGADAIRVLTREGPVSPERDAAGVWRLDLPSDGILLVISRK